DQGWVVDEKMLKVEPFPIPARMPRDVPIEQVQRLQAEIEKQAGSSHAGHSRTGKLDLAWFLLMLHSGLRTGEIRRLRLTEVDFGAKKARIEQSKGLKDRFVYLSAAVIGALQDYLAVRGPVDALPEHVFIFRHAPLSRTYCGSRLRTYGIRCGVKVSPHQLRHTCATWLLNAGAPVLMVQAILGHKHLDTTLQYARLYDGTVAQDYFAAMSRVEEMFSPLEKQTDARPNQTGEVLAALDAILSTGLSAEQAEIIRVVKERVLVVVGK
ncbi:MAG: phage integrase family protein, partial [Anaerolineales bacterium]|nr:phage integrase family protein [Anaerolineales bacterium]